MPSCLLPRNVIHPFNEASSFNPSLKYELQYEKEVDEDTSDSSEEDSDEDELYSTPDLEKRDRKRWKYLQTLSSTRRNELLDEDAKEVDERDYKEHLFTNVISEFEFDLIRPFGHNPLYERVTYPVPEDQMVFIQSQIHYYWHRKLNTRLGFADFGRHFDFKGSEYRKELLMRHARLRVIEAVMEAEEETEENENEEETLNREVERWLNNNEKFNHKIANELGSVDRTRNGGRMTKRPMMLLRHNDKEKPMKKRRNNPID